MLNVLISESGLEPKDRDSLLGKVEKFMAAIDEEITPAGRIPGTGVIGVRASFLNGDPSGQVLIEPADSSSRGAITFKPGEANVCKTDELGYTVVEIGGDSYVIQRYSFCRH